jgi:hypothetical protein
MAEKDCFLERLISIKLSQMGIVVLSRKYVSL